MNSSVLGNRGWTGDVNKMIDYKAGIKRANFQILSVKKLLGGCIVWEGRIRV